MEPSDFDVHKGLCELALRQFHRPRGALQHKLADFALYLPVRYENRLRSCVLQIADGYPPYKCLQVVTNDLFGDGKTNWGRVFVFYVFLSRLALRMQLSPSIVSGAVWSCGLRDFISKYGWTSCLSTKMESDKRSSSYMNVASLIVVVSVSALMLHRFLA